MQRPARHQCAPAHRRWSMSGPGTTRQERQGITPLLFVLVGLLLLLGVGWPLGARLGLVNPPPAPPPSPFYRTRMAVSPSGMSVTTNQMIMTAANAYQSNE